MSRHTSLILVLTVVLIVFLASACAPYGATVAPATALPAPSASAAGMANPASVFCREHGGRLEIRSDASGAQSGVCVFPDGSACDEWAFFRSECGPKGQSTPTPAEASSLVAATRAALPTATLLPATASTDAAASGAITYTSAALGISFRYLPDQNGQAIKVLEQGDRIYVYPAQMDPTAGQWVQVFRKPAGESLVDAITRMIMPGHPAQDCEVRSVDNPTGGGTPVPGYEYAGIVVRRAAGEDEETVLPRWRTCPQPYTVVGGIGYFQADRAHPDKFLFFSIGQYAILAGPDLAWQDTVKFE